jgi:flavin-dependent dehydrogenase
VESVIAPTTTKETTGYELVVIGGGPAGTSAAITAARAGVRVLLLERGKLPRQRVCGEFVSAESLDLLAALLGRAADEDAVKIPEARLFVDGSVISTPVDPPAASIARFDLDWDLWEAAKRGGVDARLECSVEDVAGTGPFEVKTSLGKFGSRAVICAAGRWSNLTAKSGNGNGHTREKWLGLKAHFAEASPHTSVDLYFFEGGYCGVQPVRLGNEIRGRVNACAMVRADVARTLPEVFQLNAELAKRSQAWQLLMEVTSTSPLIFHEPRPAQDGVLLAGDAAGFVDPFVGDGISLALRSGAMAAECLIPFFKGEIALAESAARYVRTYEDRLGLVFRNSSRLRKLLKLPLPLRRSIVGVLAKVPRVAQYMVSATR